MVYWNYSMEGRMESMQVTRIDRPGDYYSA